MMQPRMGGIIQANIPDVDTLFACYMPYVSGGGLFVDAAFLLRYNCIVTEYQQEKK